MKSLPSSAERLAVFHCDGATKNEANFYNVVLPPLKTVKKLPFPSCLLAADDLILLRHLGDSGFAMVDRKSGLDITHCRLVLEVELGRFHAASLALKHYNPVEVSKISSLVNEIFIFKENAILEPSVYHSIEMAVRVAKNPNSPVIDLLKAIQGRGFEVMSPLIAPSEPLAVVCHGDLWSNNLLFHYSEKDPQTPDKVCFLDMQLWRYASPSLDILYLLFTSAGVGVIKQHFQDLIVIYHQALMDQLGKIAPLAQLVTLNDVKEDIRQHAICGLIISLMSLPTVTAGDVIFKPDDVTQDLMQNKEFVDNLSQQIITDEYIRRVNDILEVYSSEGLI
ncbi:uncharacterized protein LOC124355598 [Homalodisca vitripennis]|uniref:uncharacterized protein LOC124355598 n=1 Tax=Homalodisca vitripennis TaxID=197043 RepID=UPI001EEA5090|nr:uncharacterized protein LOC124355598 [Homalodisca vitripennis]